MRLLLAEDDAILADALSSNLRAAGFEVEVADNGAVAEYLLLKQPFDLGVIDLGLPLVDGLTVLKRVHAARPTLPLLILTALDSLDSRVAGLNAGADDYLTKPFGTGELLARIRVALRHAKAPEPSLEAPLRWGEIELDAAAREVRLRGEPVHLTPNEFKLLEVLARHAGKVLTHPQLLREVWGGAAGAQPHYLRVYMAQLRHKLEEDPARPRHLLTELGVGYRLKVE